MSWRQGSEFVSQAKEQEKNFMKIVKKLRDIKKLEESKAPKEPNQQAKLDSKEETVKELVKFDLTKVEDGIWDKCDDVFEMLSPADQSTVGRKRQETTMKKDKERVEADRKREAARTYVPDETRRYIPPKENVMRHERPVTDLAYDKETGFLYSSAKDKYIIRWSMEGSGFLTCVSTLARHEGSVWCVDVDDELLVSGGADGFIVFWPRDQRRDVTLCKSHVEVGGIVKSLRLNKAGIVMFSDKMGPNHPAYLALLSRCAKQTLWRTTDFGPKLNQVIWGPVGQPKIFSCHDDGTLRVWGEKPDEEGNPRMMKELKPHEKAIHSMNTCGRYLLTASSDNTVQAIDVSTKDMTTQYKAKANRTLRGVAGYDWPEEKCFGFLYGGGREPREVTTSKLLEDEFECFVNYFGEYRHETKSHRAHVGPIHKCIWVPEKGLMFTGSEDGDVKLWGETEKGGMINPTPWNC